MPSDFSFIGILSPAQKIFFSKLQNCMILKLVEKLSNVAEFVGVLSLLWIDMANLSQRDSFKKKKIGYLMDPLTPRAFCQKHIFWSFSSEYEPK